MKRYMIGVITILLILTSGIVQAVPPTWRIHGYLFTVEDDYYFVRDAAAVVPIHLPIVFTEQELKDYTALDNISPKFIRPSPDWVAQMKSIAETFHKKRVEGYVKEYEYFDFDVCMSNCNSGEIITNVSESCEEYCTKWPDLHYNWYKPLAEGNLEEILIYNSRGNVVTVRVYVVKDGRTYIEYNVDPNALRVGLISWTYNYEYFSKEKAQQVLEQYLTENNIRGTISVIEYMVYYDGEGEDLLVYENLTFIFTILILIIIIIVIIILWKFFIKSKR